MRALFVVRDIASAEPMGVMQLSAILRQAGHATKLVGARSTDLARVMETFAPDVVGYTVCTGVHRYLLSVNRWLKSRWTFLSVFGGPHATFFPEMIGEDGVDVVCRGEGDGAILDIAEAVEGRCRLEDIPNLWTKTPTGIRRNDMRPLVADLDALPFADRHLKYDNDPESRDYPVKSFLASRGCPFRCTYCFNAGYAKLYGPEWNTPRTRSVRNLVDEIRQVKETSRLEFVQFRESIFPWQEPWLEEFARVYRREVGLPFYCHVRADLVTPERVRWMRDAGCVSVNMGIECGDEEYRRSRLGRSMTNEQIVSACRVLKAQGIRILADNMVGLPGTDVDTIWKTVRLNRECEVDYALAMIFQPYPGTELGERAVREGRFDGEYDTLDYSYYLRSPLRWKNARQKRQIENLHKFFSIVVEAPWLEPLVRPLLGGKSRLAYLCMFRAWYMYCYTRRIVPHRMSRDEVKTLVRWLFGIYQEEPNREICQESGKLAGPGRGDAGGVDRQRLHRGVQHA